MTNESLMKKIEKLLSLGQNNQNQHEAEAAMAKAQALLTEHNLTMADLSTDEKEDYVEKETGIGSVRYTFKVRNIVWILQKHFAVTVIIMKGGRGNESSIALFGTQENVESAIFAFHFLSETFERLWSKEYFDRCEGLMDKKQIAAERNSFMAGLQHGLNDKLEVEKKKAAEAHYDGDQDKASNALMVLDDKSLIKDFMYQKYPRTSKMSGAKVQTNSHAAFNRGFEQGSKINIAKGIAS